MDRKDRTDVAIILGVPYKDIMTEVREAKEKLTGTDLAQSDYFFKLNFWSSEHNEQAFFGPVVTGWSYSYREDLDLKPDTLAYIERTFRDKFKEVYKIDFTWKLRLIGITLSKDTYDYNNL